MPNVIFKEFEVEHICKPKLKNSYISVKNSSKIVIKTPRVSKAFIQNLLHEKENWIRKQLSKFEKNKVHVVNLEDEVLLFGDVISIDSDEVRFLRERLERLKNLNEKNILKSYDTFYKHLSNQYLVQRVEKFSRLMNLNYNSLKFRKMKSRWGSCSSGKVITLNSELIKIKKELIDYVVVHELAHLVHMNHSKNFHNFVEYYLPNAKLLRGELKIIQMIPT
ncbi:MAG: SprT family zinc-dependent metalloprotease [Sulfurimonas sp.]